MSEWALFQKSICKLGHKNSWSKLTSSVHFPEAPNLRPIHNTNVSTPARDRPLFPGALLGISADQSWRQYPEVGGKSMRETTSKVGNRIGELRLFDFEDGELKIMAQSSETPCHAALYPPSQPTAPLHPPHPLPYTSGSLSEQGESKSSQRGRPCCENVCFLSLVSD